MQNDLISRSALLERLKGQGIKEPNLRYAEGFNAGIGAAKRMLKAAPTIDAVEVVHGKWLPVSVDPADPYFRCSVCLYGTDTIFDIDEPFNYCPRCGAKMDGGADNG